MTDQPQPETFTAEQCIAAAEYLEAGYGSHTLDAERKAHARLFRQAAQQAQEIAALRAQVETLEAHKALSDALLNAVTIALRGDISDYEAEWGNLREIRELAETFHGMKARLTQQIETLTAERDVAVKTADIRQRMIDIPTAWELTRATDKDQHHERCSYRTAEMLCDCAACRVMEHVSGLLRAANERAEAAERALADLRAAVKDCIDACAVGYEHVGQPHECERCQELRIALVALTGEERG